MPEIDYRLGAISSLAISSLWVLVKAYHVAMPAANTTLCSTIFNPYQVEILGCVCVWTSVNHNFESI